MSDSMEYDATCDICEKPCQAAKYDKWVCPHCGQEYAYDEGTHVKLSPPQLEALRALMKSGARLKRLEAELEVEEQLPERPGRRWRARLPSNPFLDTYGSTPGNARHNFMELSAPLLENVCPECSSVQVLGMNVHVLGCSRFVKRSF